MKKLIFLLLVLSAEVFAQTAPSGYTPIVRLRKWASGANPSADSLNQNWTDIDTNLYRPTYQTVAATAPYFIVTSSNKNANFYTTEAQGADTSALYVNFTSSTRKPRIRLFDNTGTAFFDADTAGNLKLGKVSGANLRLELGSAGVGNFAFLTTTTGSPWDLTLPAVNATLATIDGGQNFTSVGTISSGAQTITSGGVGLTVNKTTGASIELKKTDATAQAWQIAGDPDFNVYDVTDANIVAFKIAFGTQAATFAGNITSVGAAGLVPIAIQKRTADTTYATTTDVDLGDMGFNVTSGQYYKFEYTIIYQTAATTTGLSLGLTFPAVTVQASHVSMGGFAGNGTDAAFEGDISTSGTRVLSTDVSAANTNFIATVTGVIVPSANGQVKLQWSPEAAANATIKQGSTLTVWRLP